MRKDREKQLAKTGEEPIFYAIQSILGADRVASILKDGTEYDRRFPADAILSGVKIEQIDAHGQGLAVVDDWVLAVPKALPGDRVKVKVSYKTDRLYTRASIIEYEEKTSELRTAEPFCRYFSVCGGCQYQEVAYSKQLELKRNVVVNAFKHYSELDESLIPEVRPTMASPDEREYRTKLTPHFNLPKEVRAYRKAAQKALGAQDFVKLTNKEGVKLGGLTKSSDARLPPKPLEVDLQIGYESIDGHVLDIEECPIGTKTLNQQLPTVRKGVQE